MPVFPGGRPGGVCAAVNGFLSRDDLLEKLQAPLELPGGEPELVIVDARTLRLLMGDLAQLIILQTVEVGAGHLAIGEERFAWDELPDCDV